MTQQPPRHTFRVVRRGYAREEVDAHLVELGARVQALEGERNRLAAQLAALGVESPAELRSELEAVAADVGRVLEAARQAAEAMRSRAAEDAAQWREAAQVELDEARKRATEDAVALRSDAWRTGTELLEQANRQSDRIRAAAEQDAILTRAEAEQEAHRLTASARKDIADESRLARLEAERMAEQARLAGEQLRVDANRDVEAAHAQVRNLEQRRAELMREINTARDSLAGVQAEIDERRQALEPEPEPEPAAEPRPDWTSGWADDEVRVRIVSRAGPAAGETVDAEAMAAEVRALRATGSGPTGSGEPEPEEELAEVVEAPAVEVPEPDAREDLGSVVEPPGAVELEPEPELLQPETELELAAPDEVDLSELEPVVESEVPAVDVPAPEPEREPEVDEGIDDLFARLRGGGPAVAPVVEPEPASETQPEPEPEPATEPEPAPVLRAVPAAGPDPFELRDRLLLPLTNKALRDAKRAIVDIQNVVLEELRTSGGTWVPDAAAFAALGPSVDELAAGSRAAGALAAAELSGAAAPPTLGDAPSGAELGAAMSKGLAEVLRRAADGGGGPRQQSAAVSRYFRAWRTDEAERRVRNAAFEAFHRGIIDACAALGLPAVEGRADGRLCAACPASTGQPWSPGDPPPDGTAIPPAHDDCRCTVVPRP